MKIEDYSKYYIQGSDHYLIPKDVFMELFNEMINWKEESKTLKEVINKAMSILKDNFVYDYVRSCDTTDGVGYDEIDTEHFTYKVYKILEEVSE